MVFTPSDLLPVCADAGVPLVYDVHHHRCLPDGLSVEEAIERDRAEHEREARSATLEDKLKSLEGEMEEMPTRSTGLRRKWGAAARPPVRRRSAEKAAWIRAPARTGK